MKRSFPIILAATAAVMLALVAPCAAQEADPGALTQRIVELRLAGDYTGAAAAAAALLDAVVGDPEATELDVDDATQLVATLRFAATLPEAARLELARADSFGMAMEESWAQGLYKEGAGAARQRLHLYREYFGERHLATATAEDELASLLQYEGEYEEAEPLFLDALRIRREQLGPDHVYVGATLNNLGMLHQATGDLEAARDDITESLDILTRALGDDDLNVAAITANLGILLQRMGDYDGAERHLLRALEVRRAALGDDNPDVASSLNALASFYYDSMDYAKAEPFLRRATATWQEVLGNDHPYVALSLSNMGALLAARGEYSEAEAFHRQAVDIYRATLGDEHPDLAFALHNLAHTLESEGDYAGAEPLFRESLEIRRSAFGDTHPEVAVSLNGLAHVLQVAGKYDEAEPLYREALAMHRELLGDDHLEVATDLSNLASLLEETGRLDEALGLYREALEIRTRTLGGQSAAVAYNLSSIGHLELREGYPVAAEMTLGEAASVYDAARLRAGTGMSSATMALRLRPPLVALAVSRLEQGKVDDAWPAAERALARTLADLLMSAEERSLTRAESVREDSLRSLLANLEGEVLAYAGAAASDSTGEAARLGEESRHRLLEAEADWSAFQQRLAEAHPVTEGHLFPLERIQRALGQETAIIGWIDADVGGGDVESWGYVIRHDGSVGWARCGSATGSTVRSLQRRYGKYREQISDPSSSSAGLLRDARSIWRERLEPLMPSLEGARALVVLPSGSVLGLPLETLVDDAGVLVGDRFAVSYAPSATVFAWLEERGETAGRSDAMLLVGDPPFTEADLEAMESEASEAGVARGASEDTESDDPRAAGDPERGVRGGRSSLEGLPRLPGSRAEVLSLSSLTDDATVLLGPDATEQELVELASEDKLKDYGIIHLATHALVDDERPDQSALVLSQVDLPDPLESALAGSRIYDGLLTAGEIVREWDLDCDLVSLSACETALGKEVAGEGYIGFAHAFLQAGARGMLLSLWKVEDTATSLLMRRFYENRLGVYDDERGNEPGFKMSKADALREAKAWLRAYTDADGYRPYDHPYYWSAFVLIGDRS